MQLLLEALDVLIIMLTHGQRSADKKIVHIDNLLFIPGKKLPVIKNEVAVLMQKQSGSLEKLNSLAV
jgi:hypothetical protein